MGNNNKETKLHKSSVRNVTYESEPAKGSARRAGYPLSSGWGDAAGPSKKSTRRAMTRLRSNSSASSLPCTMNLTNTCRRHNHTSSHIITPSICIVHHERLWPQTKHTHTRMQACTHMYLEVLLALGSVQVGHSQQLQQGGNEGHHNLLRLSQEQRPGWRGSGHGGVRARERERERERDRG